MPLYARQIFRCELIEVVVKCIERLLHHLRLALDHDQIHRSLHYILIGSFNGALVDSGVLLGTGLTPSALR